jgi:hypothetical protein
VKEVKCFKATKQTNRFNKNQKVWIRYDHHNFYQIYFKFRGKGRYVTGFIDKGHSSIGDIKTMDVADDFADRVARPNKVVCGTFGQLVEQASSDK